MEFRHNFFIRLLTQLFFVALQLVIVNTFFNFTSSIGSWSKNEVFVLVGLFRLIEGAFHMFFHSNILYLPELVNSGEMDLLLSKPVNSLFYVSLRRHQLHEVSTFLSGLVILLYSQIIRGIAWANILWLSVVGLVALYSIMLFFSSLSFFIPRMTALSSIWDVMSKITRFPLDILTGSSRLGLSLVGPLLLVVTLPSQIILGKVPPVYIFLEIAGTLGVFALTYKFWLYSLRHYSSASS